MHSFFGHRGMETQSLMIKNACAYNNFFNFEDEEENENEEEN
jgi:hypothetical protein